MTVPNYSVFDEMLEGVQVLDFEWRYHYVNEMVTRHARRARHELIGLKIFDIYPSIAGSPLEEKMKTCMESRVPQKFLNEFTYPDGKIGYFELRIHPVEHGILIMSVDVTDQVSLEVELRKMNEHLECMVAERTQYLADALDREKKLNDLRSRFVAFATHEFKTPLFVIELTSKLLDKLNTPPNEQQRKLHHEQIRGSIADLYQIMDNLMLLDRVERNEVYPKPLSINVVVMIQEEISRLSYLTKKGQSVIHEHEGGSFAEIDRQAFRVVVTNLLSNAIKYSENTVSIKSKSTDEGVCICFADHGIGIPKEDQEQLFSKFFRASNALEFEGTGLGLYIVSRYLEMLSGQINLESAVGKGTSVTIQIPSSPRLEVA